MAHCPSGNSSPRLRRPISGSASILSRKLLTGLFALVVALAVTIWALVLVREEPVQPARPPAPVAAAPDTGAGAPSSVPPPRQPAPAIDAVPQQAPPVQAAPTPAPAPAPPSQAAPQSAERAAASEPARPAADAPAAPKTESATDSARTDDKPAQEARPAPSAPAPTAAPATTVAPAPPLPSRPAPSFDVVRVAADGMAVIAGRAQPGATVLVLDGGEEIARVTADARGEWVALPAKPLRPGTRELSLVARMSDGSAEQRSDRVVVVVVPERQGPAVASRSSAAVAVAVARDGDAATPSRLLQVPSSEPRTAPPLPVTIETVDYDATGEVVLSGRTPPGTIVQLYLDGKPIGRAEGDANGRWTMRPEAPVAPGIYTLRIDQLGPDGRVVQRIELPFARAEPQAEAAPAGDRIVVQPGNSLWRIARRVYGAGIRYTVIYQANRDMIRDPDLIYPGQIFALPEKR